MTILDTHALRVNLQSELLVYQPRLLFTYKTQPELPHAMRDTCPAMAFEWLEIASEWHETRLMLMYAQSEERVAMSI